MNGKKVTTKTVTPTKAGAPSTAKSGAPVAAKASASAPAATSIPATGPGWDAQNIFLGVAVETDASTLGKSAGASNLDFGDQKAIIQAALDMVNKQGGVFGRQLAPVYYDVSSTGNGTQEAQAACTLWSQDKRVISASLVGRIAISDMYACLSAAKIPIISGTAAFADNADLASYSPYFTSVNVPSMDHFAGPYIAQLKAMGYFSGWNTTTGAPGPAAVKIGIIVLDDPIVEKAWNTFAGVLRNNGYAVPDVVFYDNSNLTTFSSDVLKFRSDGVTHVFLDNAAGIFYPSQAQSANYFARYAVTSLNYIESFLVGTASNQQLNGMMGVGWTPTLDVAAAQDPGEPANAQACLAFQQSEGVDVSKRNYTYTALSACDGIQLGVAALRAGGGLSSNLILQGLQKAIPGYTPASVFGAGQRAGDPQIISTMRGLQFDSSCECTKYVTGNIAIP